MTEPEKPPNFEIDARSRARVNAIGNLKAETVNFGDRVESQRNVLITEIDPIPPRREPDTWVDRTQPQADLLERIGSDRVLLTEVVAAGGFGKSLLACWAYEAAQARFDYTLWINFQKQPSFNAFGLWVLQEIGFLIQDEAISDEKLITQTIHRLSERRCLLVMDQLEEIEQSADRPSFEAFLEQWQKRGRKSTILVTTRNRFAAEDAVRYVLAGFTPQEGAAFLDKQKISESETGYLEQLSTLAEGHPLLLNLAASWLKETAGGQLNETGLGFFERLFQNNLGDPEAKVEEIFQLLLQQLPEMLQTALLEVSVYQNPFDVERAQAMQPEVMKADLELLETRGFLLKQQNCWALHPLVRQFVETALQERQLKIAAHQKAVDFFSARLQGETRDLADYLAALHHHCELGNCETAYDLMTECYNWLDLQGYYRILVDIYERLTTAWKKHLPTTEEEQRKFSAALGNLGNAYDSLGQHSKAIELHEQALTIQQESGDRNGEAANLSNLGITYSYLGQYGKAIEFHEQALTIQQEIGDRNGEAANLGNLGIAYGHLGQYSKAIELYQQALTIQQEIGDRNGEAANLGNLGIAYRLLGQYGKAIELYQQALTIQQEIGNRNGEANQLSNLGSAYLSLGQYNKAIELYEQALTIQEIGDRNGEAAVLGNLGIAYLSLGQCGKAIELYEQALTIQQEIGDRNGEAAVLGNLGIAYLSLGQCGKAIELYEQALTIMQEVGDRHGEANQLGNLGSAYFSQGQYGKAIELYQQALNIDQEIGDRKGEAASLGNLGNAHDSLGQHYKAIELYQQALNIQQEIGDRHGEAINFFNQAFAYTAKGKPLTAKQSYEAAKAIFEELKLDYRVKECEQAVYALNQTIVMQPHRAPTIGDRETNQAEEDWVQKSMPNLQPSPSRSSQSQSRWLPYVAIAIAVFVLIIIVQR